ncbi:MAG: hypothetical protein WCG85_15980 [Polyangia bacterium]
MSITPESWFNGISATPGGGGLFEQGTALEGIGGWGKVPHFVSEGGRLLAEHDRTRAWLFTTVIGRHWR